MKRYFKLLLVALFATMSFAFTSCGDDDDEPNIPGQSSGTTGGSIKINGVNYAVADFMTLSGEWDKNGTSDFGFYAYLPGQKEPELYMYLFEFTTSKKPKVGDNLSGMKLKFDPMFSHYSEEAWIWDQDECEYVNLTPASGSATITAIGNDKMTVRFSGLKVTGKGVDPLTYKDKSYTMTFDGEVTVDFYL